MITNRKGFTLIELLVVIAIIAILAAILFPVFLTAKQSANSSACLANLKQLAMASQMYTQENNERYPMVPVEILSNNIEDPVTGRIFNGSEPLTSLMQVAFAKKYSIQALLQRYLKNKAVWKCPSDATCNPNPTINTRWTSYPFRYFITSGTVDFCIGWYPSDWKPFSTSKFPYQSRTFLLSETMPFHTKGGTYVSYEKSFNECMKDGNEKMNFAFMDGHVGRYPLSRVCRWVDEYKMWDYGWPSSWAVPTEKTKFLDLKY